jgi:hypothetical protein
LPEVRGELWVQNYEQPLFFIEVTKEIKQYDGKIIECFFEGIIFFNYIFYCSLIGDEQTGTWKFLRERTDKSLPNAYSTAMSMFCFFVKLKQLNYWIHLYFTFLFAGVCGAIRFPITKDTLIDFIRTKGWRKTAAVKTKSAAGNSGQQNTSTNMGPPAAKMRHVDVGEK